MSLIEKGKEVGRQVYSIWFDVGNSADNLYYFFLALIPIILSSAGLGLMQNNEFGEFQYFVVVSITLTFIYFSFKEMLKLKGFFFFCGTLIFVGLLAGNNILLTISTTLLIVSILWYIFCEHLTLGCFRN